MTHGDLEHARHDRTQGVLVGAPELKPSAGFVWPPRPVSGEDAGPADAQSPSPGGEDSRNGMPEWDRRRSTWRMALAEIEEAWLGVTAASFRLAAARTGWRADEPGAYCARCGATTGPHDADPPDAPGGPACSRCREQRLAWRRFIRLGEFDGVLRDAVHELKFSGWRRVGVDLGRVLGQSIRSRLLLAGVPASRAVLVPVPTTLRRRLWRGIDHTLVLARAVRKETGIQIVRVLRRRHRPSQLDVPRSSRRSNVARAFRPRLPCRLAGKVVIVLDDVVTTGATMSAACRAIQSGVRRDLAESGRVNARGNPEIWAACLGVAVEKPDR